MFSYNRFFPLALFVVLVSLWGSVSFASEVVVAEDLFQHPERFELVFHRGLFIPANSRGFLKYSQGNWRTGWVQKKGRTFIHGARGKLYLPVISGGNMELALSAKASRKLQSITVAANNSVKGVIRLSPQGWNSYALPMAEVPAGDVMFDLRINRTKSGIGPDIGWIWLGEQDALPKDESGKPAISLESAPSVGTDSVHLVPNSAVRIYLFPHDGVWLGLGFASAGLVSISATADDGTVQELIPRTEVQPNSVLNVQFPQLANKVFFIEIRNLGTSNLELSSAKLLANKLPPLVDLSTAPRPKNVIVYLIDTLRRDKLSIYNPNTRVKTPNIERLAKQGVVFDNCYVQGNWSKASSAAFFTGLYPQKTRAETVSEKLSKKLTLLPERLKKNGITTAAFISNGYLGAKFGFRQGWDYYRNPIRENLPSDTEHLLRLFWPWFEKHKQNRFFVYLGTIDPHVPYDPPKKFLKMYDPKPYNYKKGPIQPRKTGYLLAKIKKNPKIMSKRDWFHLEALYDGEVSYNDDQLGKLWDRLVKEGVAQDTMLIITSDHGDEFRDHGSVGHGHTVYEELIHMPLIVVYPPLFAPAKDGSIRRIEDYVEHIDIHATILDAMGVGVPKDIDGESFLPLVVDPTPHKRWYALSTMLDRYRTVITGNWKLLLKGPSARLFNLSADPKEKNNIREKHPIVSEYLRGIISPWIHDTWRSYRKEPLP